MDAWIGEGVAYRSLDNREIPNLLPGWHRFSIFDTHGDGNCCEHGSGYISLTGPIAVAGGEKGLIWGSDGSFWSFDEVFFHGLIGRVASKHLRRKRRDYRRAPQTRRWGLW